MAKCEFTLNYQGSKQQWVEKIQSEIQKAKGRVEFNGDWGSFSIPILASQIQGSFCFQGHQILVTIEEKPFMITCSKIESTLAEFMR